jgi:hypothetical protein
MTAGIIAIAGTVIGPVMEAARGPYPPSFDNSPIVFGWALFSRILILTLSVASLVRISSRNRTEKVEANHPVYYHRMTVSCFLTAAAMGSLSDVINYLTWGEVSERSTMICLMTSQILNALTMFPMVMALFVPVWLRWLCRAGVLKTAPKMTLNGVVNDVRTTWESASIPMQLLVASAIGSAAVTVAKYWWWREHGAF